MNGLYVIHFVMAMMSNGSIAAYSPTQEATHQIVLLTPLMSSGTDGSIDIDFDFISRHLKS